MKKIVFSICFGLLLFNSHAQDPIKIDLVRGMSPQEFVETHIANAGIKVSNAKFNLSAANIVSDQIGIFTNPYSFSEFPFLSGGIVLSTGNCELAGTVNDGPYYWPPEPKPYGIKDTLLEKLIGGQGICFAILEFDFVSVSSEIKLDYIFASEEYAMYVCSVPIDGFAIFVTGPDPENPLNIITRNIALIPGTDIPVGINSVNIGQKGDATVTDEKYCTHPKGSLAYSKYYIHNMPRFPIGPYSKYIQYDGFTTILTAKATVIPEQTYSMRISLASAGPDGLNDSGLFIKKKGFQASFLNYELSGDIPKLLDAVEGCNRVTVTLSTTHGVTSKTEINITTGGTAIEGTDYLPLTEKNYQLKSNDTVKFMIDPVFSGVQKEDRSVILYIYSKFYNAEGVFINGQYDTITVWIKYNDYVVLKAPVIPPVCKKNYFEGQVSVEKIKGQDNLKIQWIPKTGVDNPFSLTSNVYVTKTTTFRVIATEQYGCFSDTAEFTISILPTPVLDFTITPTSGCFPLTCDFLAEVKPSYSNLTWKIDGKTVTDNTDFIHTFTDAGTYTVTVVTYIDPLCIDSSSQKIMVEECIIDTVELIVVLPNIFTPNGDGFNDTFKPDITGSQKIISYNMYIYDRWGRLVFSTQDYDSAWDGNNKSGNPYAEGVYYCVLYYTDTSGKEYTKQSSVTLKR